MKTSFKSLFAVAAFGASALLSCAEVATKIFVVDIGKVYDGHYKSEEFMTKLQAEEQKANQEFERLNTEGNGLVEQYKEKAAQVENPALNDEARKKIAGEAQQKLEEIKAKQNEVQNFRAKTQQALQQRFMSFRGMLLEEIAKLTSEIAKKKGATLVFDKSGPSGYGISNIIYSDAGYDITDEVMAEINKTRPASVATPAAAPAAAPAAPKAAAPATGEAAPTISFPGAKK